MLSKRFRLKKVIETHSKLPKQIRIYSRQVKHFEIDNFALILERLIPEAKPDKSSKSFYENKSFAIYIKRDE